MVKNRKVNIDLKKKSENDELSKQQISEPEIIDTESDNDSPILPFLWLCVFSMMMFTFPFLTFYGVKDWIKTSFDMSVFETNCYSVLSAVVVVNLIICMFVWKAFSENVKPIRRND